VPYTPNGVVTQLFSFEDFTFTMSVSGSVVAADVGKAVALDTTAANTVKLAGDGDQIFGRLETFENRTQEGIKVGAISRKLRAKLPVKTGLTGFNVPAVGDTVVGAGAGEVKASNNGSAKTPDQTNNTVIEVGTGFVVVEKL
jgi:hypothetical protein